ncbi:VOC family protein [Rufibacter latericius]|uniref:VOC family protein n=1 Tax=Rufibacter latericius TaxID=2487040 RepID=A0A3M9MKK5_9BACT|nr:VOC family protein [Rufibacter latericius]RNI26011.1 VOC family protein [Rufibacter latericius]
MEPRITLITLGVANVATATDFYESVFGWQRAEGSQEGITFFQLNGFQLALFGAQELAHVAQVPFEQSSFKGFSLAHNLRSEAEVDALFQELETKDVTIVKKPEKVFWGGYSGYFQDLDGHLWEVAFNPFLPLDPTGNVMVS